MQRHASFVSRDWVFRHPSIHHMHYQRNEDLFESTKMTFGEHLEELRLALFKSALALVFGFVMGLTFARHVILWIEYPLKSALQVHYRGLDAENQRKLLEQLKAQNVSVTDWTGGVPGRTQDENLVLEEYFIDVQELVRVLRERYPQWLSGIHLPDRRDGAARESREPLQRILVWRKKPLDVPPLISTGLPDAFMVYIKVSLFTGAIIASPLVFYFLWGFVAAGLYPHEKRYVHIFMPFSLALFLAGVALAFFFVLYYVLIFFLGFNSWLGIDPYPRINEWLNFVMLLPLGFGVSFQLPLVMLFLERIGIFTVQMYWEKWRIAILAICVISMLLTPSGDPQSMILMGVPLTVLYFGGILLCRFMPRHTNLAGQAI
jgi:sec-independent protein translocase protein TatC